MRKLYMFLFLAGILCAVSCTKVSNLSDEAAIKSFEITKVSEGVQLALDNIQMREKSISIPLEYGRKNFPLTISTNIKFSPTTDRTISTDEKPLNLKEFTFYDVYTPQEFYMISESGVPHLATISLLDKPNAEITGFEIKNLSKEDVSVTFYNNNIRITLKKAQSWPLTISPEITKTPSASYIGYTEGQSFTFLSSVDTERHITLKADNGDERVWNIQIVPSIENSDFEAWINENTKSINIDPKPGKGLGWATANNIFVSGTTPVSNNGGKAAQMMTGIQDLSSIGLGQLITAGTLYTGYFQMNISQLDNPAAMAYFGIPFIMRPASISIDAKYVPGNLLQQSVKKGSGYKLQDLSGTDKGRIWVKLLHWKGNGALEFHDKPVDGLTELGAGELIFEGSDYRNWKNYKIAIKYNPLYSHLEPTHISVVMTSSMQGDYFIGAQGSTLTVDNLEINY